MEKVLITGGTGLIGKYLSDKLVSKGYEVAFLSRKSSTSTSIKSYQWNVEQMTMDEEAISSSDYIVHLAGANIGEKRWTAKRRKEIVESRVNSGKLLYDTFKKSNSKLKAFISASAVGYYGAITSEKIYTEADAPRNDFLGKTCEKWEESISGFEKLGIRTVKIRTSLVLSKKGGALDKLIIPFKWGIGSPSGSGKQFMPWIHIDDLCGIYIKAIEDSKMQGVYNAVAPEHCTNKVFSKTLAEVLKKPFFFPNIPSFLLKLILGEMSDVILKGSRVSSEKISKAGYEFIYPKLKEALENVLNVERK
jgi:uncharacterized protein (TIGR01777 family)